MRFRFAASTLLLAMMATGARAQAPAPREIWPQATSAAREGDTDQAKQKLTELFDTGKAYGLKTYPLYASAAAGYAYQSDQQGRLEIASWASAAAAQLDKTSPTVAFTAADHAAARHNWARALPAALRGLGYILTSYRARLLSRADLIVVVAMAVALTAIIFSVALFIRYARSMAHDFREIIGDRIHGGSVSVLAFALLFLPIFLWLGPMWLVFYWFVIFFGYANKRERAFIVIITLLVAALPLAVELASHWAAGVDGPVVMSAISSAEQSYQPEALRRMTELVTIVPDNPTLQVLLGNLHVFEGDEQQAAEHYRRAIQINDSAGAHVNLGNLHFLQNDYAAAITEYGRAQKRDPRLAIAFYNDSVASGETYRFEEQGRKLEQAKAANRELIEKLAQAPPQQKVAMYHPPISEAWAVTSMVAKRGVARSLFGNYSYFDPQTTAANPVTLGALAALVLSLLVWAKRRKAGFAGSCIKCGRTFCHRCKSARESSTYCTQCIHIYLKRDGVAIATKRSKMEEVSDHQTGMQRRNKFFATFLPGSAQLLEGRTSIGLAGTFLFFFFVGMALLIGRLAPVIGPVGSTTHLAIRAGAILVAALLWLTMSLPVYRRKAVVS
jgi:tetratricopeptide (TPR) repeat protein